MPRNGANIAAFIALNVWVKSTLLKRDFIQDLKASVEAVFITHGKTQVVIDDHWAIPIFQ